MRRAHLASALVLMVTILPLVPSGTAAARGERRGSGDPGLLGADGTGTGVLPNFRERGEHLIRLQVGAFDPLDDQAPRPAGIPVQGAAELGTTEVAYWLVQVEGGRFADAITAVQATGALIAGYVHDDTYMVRATPLQVGSIDSNPSIRWTGLYQPSWRVPVAAAGKPGLLDLDGQQTYRVRFFLAEPELEAAVDVLRGISGLRIVENAGVVVDVRATSAQVPAIAAIPAVEWIGIKPRAELLNANSRWVNDTGVRDVYAATAPGRLTGAGQTAAVADTGVNYTYDLNGRAHVAFRDCDSDGSNCLEAIYTQLQPGTGATEMNTVVDHNTGHRKMVAYFDLGSTGPNPFDSSSHGSHTGGSVTGDQPPYDEYTGEDGLAPAAHHVHQNIGTSSGGLALPGDDYDLWRQAYRPRDPASVLETSGPGGNPTDYGIDYLPLEDARTHNNSYGLIAPVIDEGSAAALDRFVWDHEDMVIVVSAGNGGPGPLSIGSPSVAKNELSSGASANGRQPMASIDSMAQFSSHGPTADGRYGPDLATPGQIVVSVKGGTTDGYHTAQGTSMSAPVLTGLSTLVRQYFFDGYAAEDGDGFAVGTPDVSGPRAHNPSAALVKAALINGAERMRGFYTGDDGNNELEDGQWPSAGQGFGRVDLDNSLYFEDDPARNWYTDVYRGDTVATSCPQGTELDSCTSFPASNTAAQRTFTMHVDEGQPFDVSLSWTDAPDLLPVGSPALVNNLNLIVTAPDGTTEYVGNNMNTRATPTADEGETLPGVGATDSSNLSERVRIADPAAGDYTITVEAGPISMGNQGFALAASGDLSAAGADDFSPGPALQTDDGTGPPVISNVRVETLSADTAEIRFETNEPTTAVATVDPGGTATEFEDSYVEDPVDGFPGLNEDPAFIETSEEYADKLMVGTEHEILLTGLSAGETHDVDLTATDLAANATAELVEVDAPDNAFQANAGDTAYCVSGQPDCQWAGLPHDQGPRPVTPSAAAPPTPNDNYATQMYASGGSSLGAFMFRLPDGTVEPSEITGAAVEMVSAHNWVVPYTQDPVLSVDLLNEGVESSWEAHTHSYSSISGAPSPARAYPETAHKRGAYYRYAFTFRCNDLEALRTSLENDRAAFRYDSNGGGLFSMDIGFNRRSRGPDLRPRLVLHTATSGDPIDEPCDPGAPDPVISNVGIHPGITETDDDTQPVTVSWDTNVSSDSIVLFREDGATDWTQVGTPQLTRVHHVEVFGLDPATEYEFAVRSTDCDGDEVTDANAGAGYDFFRPAPPPPPPTTDHFFHGNPGDQAAKGSPPPHGADTLTFSTDPADGTPGTQTGTIFANSDFVANPLAFYWSGPFSGNIDTDVQLRWYWSTSNATAIALGSDVEVTFFADPDYAAPDPVQADKIIGRQVVNLTYDAPGVPTLNENTVPVTGSVTDTLLIQVVPVFLDTGQGITAHYDEPYPSNFGIPEETGAPPPSEQLPLTGPVPPPSAEETGLDPPATRTDPFPRDLAAGTGMCGGDASAIPEIQITDPDDGEEVSAGDLPILGTSAYDSGTANVIVRAQAPGYDSGPVQAQTSNDFRDWSAVIDLSGQEGKTITIRARLFIDGAEVDLDAVTVTVASGGGGAVGGDGDGGDVCARLARSGDTSFNVIVGTGGKDQLVGTPGPDAICGRAGKDKIRGKAGHDILVGGPANDRLIGAGGRDRLQAGKGNDMLNGGVGADKVVGHKGNDRLRGGGGKDRLNGMGGTDRCKGGGGKDRFTRCETAKQ